MTETPDQIAARYGARAAPGVVVQRIAPGVSARPLPVWDAGKNCLVVPDWKEQRKRDHAATMRAGRRMRERDPEVVARQARVRAMQARGLTLDAMMVESGLSEATLKNDLRAMGLGWARDAELVSERIRAGRQRREAPKQALVAGLVAGGADEEAIAEATGIRNRKWLRDIIRRVKPEFVFQNKKKGPPKGRPVAPRPQRPAPAPTEAQRALAARLAKWRAEGLTYQEIGDRLGKTRQAVGGYILRFRALGLIGDGLAEPERRAA